MFDERSEGAGGGDGGGDAATHVGRDWREIDRRMRRLAARRAALDVEEARMLMLAKRAEIHRHLGYGSFAEYIERVLGYAPNTGRDRVRVAEEIEQLPAIAEAWAHGRLSYSVVREITRIATPENEEDLLVFVEGMTVREVEEAMRGRRKGDDPYARKDPDLEPRIVRMELPPQPYALFLEARRLLERKTGATMSDADFMAALCGAAVRGAAMTSDEIPANVPPYQIAIVVCGDCKRGWHDTPGRSVELRPGAVERAKCDAVLLGNVVGDAASLTRGTRTIPPHIRRAVLARDHHRCQVPGCTMSRWVDVHHILHWEDGGSHDPRNLITLCELHHSQHHDGIIHIAGEPGALVVTHREGRPYGASPPPPPPPTPPDHSGDAKRALTSMGFRGAEAAAAVARAATHVGRAAGLEELIRAALRELAPPRPGA